MRIWISFFSCLALMACAAPGKGTKAEEGFRICNKIIAAIEKFKTDRGNHPTKLSELVDTYIETIPEEIHGYPIEYLSGENAYSDKAGKKQPYSLGFSYVNYAKNICFYEPLNKKWNCHGYM